MDLLLEVDRLQTHYLTDDMVVKAVDGISFSVERGKCIGIVGESGCGKSQTALSIMGLLTKPQGRIVGGSIIYHGRDGGTLDLASLDQGSPAFRSIRGRDISMIFQEPMSSLSPVYTIGDQIAEALTEHTSLSRKAALARTIELLKLVGIPAPEKRALDYPHNLSGGMCQRAMIAMALACEPRLLIADEPTTALDVTIQLQILGLLKGLQGRLSMGLIMITHDLGVIAEVADEVLVMYLGRTMEKGSVRGILRQPRHPYTRGLLMSRPTASADKARLKPIKGMVPSAAEVPEGCPFSSRCPEVMGICSKPPPFASFEAGHEAACWLFADRH